MPLLTVQDLSVDIGSRPILKSISLHVAPGEILGVVGESGSGKSTTLLSVMRLLARGSNLRGAITFDGQDILAKSEREMCAVRGRGIAMIFQEPMTALNPVQAIGRQVAEMFLLHRSLSLGEAMRAAADRLSQVGLPPDRTPLDRYPHQLSGGQRQRVVIAMATALNPKLLLADEPTSALDVTTQAAILELLKKPVRRDGAAMILVTHDLAVVAGIADRIAIMKGGEIVEDGPAPSILRALRHPYSKALLAAATLPPAKRSPKPEAPAIAEAEHITVDYGSRWSFLGNATTTRAVDDVSLRIAPGEIVAVVGESGSGKSTLARAMLGLETPATGRVHVAGTSFAKASRRAQRAMRREIQVVFQDPYGSLNPRHRVGTTIAEPLHLLDQPLSALERHRRVDTMLERVGLSPADAGKFPHEFSGGQRQRIAIARALILQPQVVVLDEAVSALDVSIRAQIIDLLKDLSERQNLAYLFITHDLAVVRALADRVLVMQNGRLVEEGRVAEMFALPKHAHTRELLAASPTLETVLAARERNDVPL